MANRVSQLPIEIVRQPSPHVRLSQLGLEAVRNPNPNVRLAHFSIELVRPFQPQPVQQLVQFVAP